MRPTRLALMLAAAAVAACTGPEPAPAPALPSGIAMPAGGHTVPAIALPRRDRAEEFKAP